MFRETPAGCMWSSYLPSFCSSTLFEPKIRETAALVLHHMIHIHYNGSLSETTEEGTLQMESHWTKSMS